MRAGLFWEDACRAVSPDIHMQKRTHLVKIIVVVPPQKSKTHDNRQFWCPMARTHSSQMRRIRSRERVNCGKTHRGQRPLTFTCKNVPVLLLVPKSYDNRKQAILVPNRHGPQLTNATHRTCERVHCGKTHGGSALDIHMQKRTHIFSVIIGGAIYAF